MKRAMLSVGDSATPDKPSAPTSPITHDGLDTFDWTFVTGFSEVADYEITVLNTGWATVTFRNLIN
ncbi:hypothetical protein OH492_14345 [Vibrio chagasii]|nr:hypothetical protein [Vibrio chagasii]